MSTVKDYVQLHFVVLIWGFTAILGQLISITDVELVFFRTLLAAIFLVPVLRFRKTSFSLPARSILKLFFTGFLLSVHWILFFVSASVSTISICLAGLATCALWTSLWEPLVTRKKIEVTDIILGLSVIAGLVIIFNNEEAHFWGLFTGILSAFIASVFTVSNSSFTKQFDPYLISFYELWGAFVCSGILLPVYSYFFLNGQIDLVPTAMDWLWLIILSSVCTVFAYSKSIELMQRISAFAVNLSVNMEPVYGIILAVIIFREREQMTSGFYFGTLIILLSVFAYPVINYLKRRRMGRVTDQASNA
jgi:drug/metabolite transporter (DMT)-like permease